MKRLVNPSIAEINELYALAKQQNKILVEVMDASNSGIHGWDFVGSPDENQVIYLLTAKELACWKHKEYDILYKAAA